MLGNMLIVVFALLWLAPDLFEPLFLEYRLRHGRHPDNTWLWRVMIRRVIQIWETSQMNSCVADTKSKDDLTLNGMV